MERPLLRILEVPLSTSAPDLQRSLQEFFNREKAKAALKRKSHCHARHGTIWVQGLACKTGPPQRQLEFFNFGASRSECAAAAGSAEAAEPPRADVPRAAEGERGDSATRTLGVASRAAAIAARPTAASVTAALRGAHGKRACAEQLRDGRARQTKTRQTTL